MLQIRTYKITTQNNLEAILLASNRRLLHSIFHDHFLDENRRQNDIKSNSIDFDYRTGQADWKERLSGRETLGHDGRRLRPGTAAHR